MSSNSSSQSFEPVLNEDGSQMQAEDGNGNVGWLFKSQNSDNYIIIPFSGTGEPEMKVLGDCGSSGSCEQDIGSFLKFHAAEEEIWLPNRGNRPSQLDRDATSVFIKKMLQPSFASMLKDRSTKKTNVWKIMGEEMKAEGFHFGSRSPQDVCCQKYNNLKKMYEKHLSKIRSTGGGKVDEPEHWGDLHTIFGELHGFRPVKLHDSLLQPSSSKAAAKRTADEAGWEEESTSHFKRCVPSTMPKKKATAVKMYNLMKEDVANRKEQHEEILNHLEATNKLLEVQNRQREDMVQILGRLVPPSD